jgi:hypothetical protein
MGELSISGRMTVKTLKKQFFEEFGASLRVYQGKKFADEDATLASIRTNDSKGGEFKCAGNMQIGNFEKKIKELYGIIVQVADKENKRLINDNITLAKASEIVVKTRKHKDKSTINGNDDLVFARQLEKDDTLFFGAEIAIQSLSKEQVSKLLDCLENKYVTNNDNDFLIEYFENVKFHKIGIPLNNEYDDLDNLSDNENLSSDEDVNFYVIDTDECYNQPVYINDDISSILSETGFKLITVRFEDIYMKRKGEVGVPVYPGINKIPLIGSLVFDEPNYSFLDEFYQSNDCVHVYDEDICEIKTEWNNLKKMYCEDGDGNGNIYGTYQILIHIDNEKIDFEDLTVDEIKDSIGLNNFIIYSNRETEKLVNVEVEEDISPYQIENYEFDEEVLSEKIAHFRSLIK